jgi:hypothetical protein
MLDYAAITAVAAFAISAVANIVLDEIDCTRGVVSLAVDAEDRCKG